MKSILPYILLIALLAACSKDEDPAGPAGALNKPFNLALGGIESTTGYKIAVSPDGTKVLVGIGNDVNPEFHYSKDGGATFSPALSINLRYASEISSNGLVLTSQNRVYQAESGVEVPISGGETVILGDKGKVFVYHFNSATISYKNVGEPAFQPITKPVPANPGSAEAYSAIKVPGKGLAFVVSPINRSDKTISAHILDEATMTWSSHSAPVVWNSINGCNNLGQFERFVFGSNNTLIMKGCTGMALMDLAAGTTKYVAYPAVTNSFPESFRDGLTMMDTKGSLYVAAGVAGEPFFRLYQFKDNKWEALPGNAIGTQALAMDNNNNIFYNSEKSEGTIIRSPVKVNVQSGTKTLLALPRTKEQIFDAIVVDDEVVFISSLKLYRYGIAGGELTKVDLSNISHFNILSDGRWVAGGADEINISTDKGKTWTKTDKLFSPSLTQFQVNLVVTDTRIVNGQVMILGTSTYYYNNQSLGSQQVKHDNLLVSLSGGKQNYQFPPDLSDGVIGPDGTLYGVALFVSEFGTVSDFYEIKTGVAPKRLTVKQGPTPHIIGDDGLQITLRGAFEGGGLEIFTRKSVDEDWTSVSEKLPNTSTVNGIMKLRAGGKGLTFVNGPEVYVAGN
jgi:hypothetical protein